jgi:hypothetical protein
VLNYTFPKCYLWKFNTYGIHKKNDSEYNAWMIMIIYKMWNFTVCNWPRMILESFRDRPSNSSL